MSRFQSTSNPFLIGCVYDCPCCGWYNNVPLSYPPHPSEQMRKGRATRNETADKKQYIACYNLTETTSSTLEQKMIVRITSTGKDDNTNLVWDNEGLFKWLDRGDNNITEDIHSHSSAIGKQNQDYYNQIESK